MSTWIIRCVLALVCLVSVLVPISNSNSALAAGDTTVPTVWIVSPTDGSIVSGSKIRVTFYAFDLGGFDRYELYVDGILKQTVLPTARGVYFTWNTGKGGNGYHTLVVRAYDMAGNVGTSAPITVFKQ